MLVLMVRTIILYIFAIIVLRMMGKRQIGELQPFELVIAIMISELATLPMQDNRMPLINGIIPMVTLLMLQIVLSWLQLKSSKIRGLVCGKPSILISNGKIDIKELKNQRINIDDLMEELRLQGYFNIQDIEYAVFETDGQLSIIPKSDLENVKREDLNIKTNQAQLPVTLILDGKVNEHNLKKVAKKNLNWLKKQLNQNKIQSSKDVFIAIIDSNGQFYCQTKKEGENKK